MKLKTGGINVGIHVVNLFKKPDNTPRQGTFAEMTPASNKEPTGRRWLRCDSGLAERKPGVAVILDGVTDIAIHAHASREGEQAHGFTFDIGAGVPGVCLDE